MGCCQSAARRPSATHNNGIHTWLEGLGAGYGQSFSGAFRELGYDTAGELQGLTQAERDALVAALSDAGAKTPQLRLIGAALDEAIGTRAKTEREKELERALAAKEAELQAALHRCQAADAAQRSPDFAPHQLEGVLSPLGGPNSSPRAVRLQSLGSPGSPGSLPSASPSQSSPQDDLALSHPFGVAGGSELTASSEEREKLHRPASEVSEADILAPLGQPIRSAAPESPPSSTPGSATLADDGTGYTVYPDGYTVYPDGPPSGDCPGGSQLAGGKDSATVVQSRAAASSPREDPLGQSFGGPHAELRTGCDGQMDCLAAQWPMKPGGDLDLLESSSSTTAYGGATGRPLEVRSPSHHEAQSPARSGASRAGCIPTDGGIPSLKLLTRKHKRRWHSHGADINSNECYGPLPSLAFASASPVNTVGGVALGEEPIRSSYTAAIIPTLVQKSLEKKEKELLWQRELESERRRQAGQPHVPQDAPV